MKLIFCTHCQDVIRLQTEPRYCKCRQCGGFYEADGLHAHYWGFPAYPVGFANDSFVSALRNQPVDGVGKEFTAFVIPHGCPTFKWHLTEVTVVSQSDGEAPPASETSKQVV